MSYKNFFKEKSIFQLQDEVERKFIDVMKNNYQNITSYDLKGIIFLMQGNIILDMILIAFLFSFCLFVKKKVEWDFFTNLKQNMKLFPLIYGFISYMFSQFISNFIPVVRTEFLMISFMLLIYI